MTRIVAGALGGRRLAVPERGTRPTSERVREAMFSAIGARMELVGARVLDCYAGSGALGIEALSRGAEHALFLESDRRAAAVLTRNLAALGVPRVLGVPGRGTDEGEGEVRGGEVCAATVESVAARVAARAYDLLVADPPYALASGALCAVLGALLRNGWLASGALLAVERPARAGELAWPDGLLEIGVRRYGDTVVCYGRRP